MNLVCLGTFGISALLFLGTGYALHRRHARDDRTRWWFVPPLLFWLVFCCTFLKWLNGPHLDWNAARLTVGVAWAHGVKVFSMPGQGPFLCAAYGPLMPILYAPAALLQTPTLALLGGVFLSMLYFFVPAFLLLWPTRQAGRVERFWSFCLMALCVALSHVLAGLNYQAYAVHVDGAAIGFTALACWALMRRRTPDDWRWLFCSSVAMVLAGSCKQIAAPVAIVLPCYVWLLDGWRAALRFALLLGLTALAFALLWHLLFDLRAVWYCIVQVPLRFPKGPGFTENLYNVLKKVKWVLPLLMLGSLLGVGSIRAMGGWRAWLRQPWVLLFVAGLAVVPTSVRAMQVYNGSTNSLHCLALWMFAFCLLLKEYVLRARPEGARVAIRALAILLVVATPLVAGLKHWRRVEKEAGGDYFLNRRELAYRYTREHPGVMFPWEPLSMVMANGRAYHFDYGIHAQELAGYPVERKTQLDPFVPEGLRAFAYIPNQKRFLLSYYPEFSRCVSIPELPGFELFVRPDDASFAGLRGVKAAAEAQREEPDE